MQPWTNETRHKNMNQNTEIARFPSMQIELTRGLITKKQSWEMWLSECANSARHYLISQTVFFNLARSGSYHPYSHLIWPSLCVLLSAETRAHTPFRVSAGERTVNRNHGPNVGMKAEQLLRFPRVQHCIFPCIHHSALYIHARERQQQQQKHNTRRGEMERDGAGWQLLPRSQRAAGKGAQ